MDEKDKDRIAAEIAADYRTTIRETAAAELRNQPGRPSSTEFKSIGLAYFLWLGFGTFGAHRFYLGYPFGAAGMLMLTIFTGVFSLQPSLSTFGHLLGVALMVWWLADAFLIPRLLPAAPDY